MEHADIVIAGAGLIGCSLALELARRGLSVTLLSEAEPFAHASTAAAGMLAVDDPENPPALHPLSQLSRELYPAFLDQLASAAPHAPTVHFQTAYTLQALASDAHDLPSLSLPELTQLAPELHPGTLPFALLREHSLDPRELAAALRIALAATPRIRLLTGARVLRVTEESSGAIAHTTSRSIGAARFIDCTGAWSLVAAPSSPPQTITVSPRKGQLLTVTLPADLPLTHVIRTPSVYIVPRLHGAQRGRAVIGATVEDRGFDVSVEPAAIAALHAAAAALVPALSGAPVSESWAGLRPATTDGLPLLGQTGAHTFISKGHFRNGILLAPATARCMADLITGDPPPVDLTPFSPHRTLASAAARTASHSEALPPAADRRGV